MVARGVSEVLRPEGYQVALYDTDHDPVTETQVVRTITDRMVDGAIVFGFEVKPADAEIFARANKPFVNGGLDDAKALPWDSVRVDQTLAFRDLVASVAKTGRGPIAYVGGPAEEGSSAPREKGFREGIAAAGQRPDPALMADSAAYSWEGGRTALGRILARGTRPGAVICANDMIAIGAMQAARDAGLRIPEDIAITGYDNIDAAEMTLPPLTTVEAFPFEQGRACARLLLDRLRGEVGAEPRHLLLGTEIVERDSL